MQCPSGEHSSDRASDASDKPWPAVILAAFFVVSTVLALLGLCAVALSDVPRITGTVALIVTLAALAAAIVH
ncbi:hypothetical protein [Streptomyces sp. NPDC048560]|uniref:hypothetical protein n=1 Tax=Streptomyces sp. NPDC048560 TaxID=3155488 RepID=UPI00341F01D5